MKMYSPLSKLIFLLFLIPVSNVNSQVLDTLDGVTKMTEDGFLVTHNGYKLEFISNATVLYNLKDEVLHRAYRISPIIKYDYEFNEVDGYEFYDPIEVMTEVNDYVRVEENFGSYLYCISNRKVVSPILDVDTRYEVVSFYENYDSTQNVTIVYTAEGKQGFYSSETGLFSEAKYTEIYFSPEKTYGIAMLAESDNQFVVINLYDPNKIMAIAEEIISSRDIVEPIAIDEWNEEYKDSMLFNSEFFMLRNGNQYGILSKDLYFCVPPEFESITQSPFSESLLLVTKNGKYGYIDLDRRNVLEPNFETIPDVSYSEYAPYLFANTPGSSTKTGMDGYTYPVDYFYQHIGLKDDDDSADGNEWGIKQCDVDGNLLKFITNPTGTFLEDDINSYGYYTIRSKKKYGLCSKFGEVIVAPNYSRIDDALYFEGKSDMVLQSVKLRSGKKVGMYLPQYEEIIEPLYDDFYDIYSYANSDFEGWIVTQKKKRGFMNSEGDILFFPSYKYIDLAELSIERSFPLLNLTTFKGLQGIANTEGDILIEPMYESLEFFDTGDTNWVFYLGFSEKKTFVGVIGKEEPIEIQDYQEFIISEALLNNTHSIIDLRDGKYGLLNLNNEEIFPFEFENIMIDSHFVGTNYTIVLGYKEDKIYPLIYSNVQQRWITKELKAYDAVIKGKGYQAIGDEQIIIDLFADQQW